MELSSTRSPDRRGPTEQAPIAGAAPVPVEELRLRHSVAYSVVGRFGYIFTQMAILAALAQLRGAEAVGEFGLALALTTPAFTFVKMGGGSSQSSDVTHQYTFSEYGSLVVAAAALATLASIAAGYLFTSTDQAFLIVVIVALTKAVESISHLSYGAFQQAGRMDKVAVSLLLRGALTLPLFTALLLLGLPVGLAFLAQLLVWSLLAIFCDYPLASRMAAGRLVWPSRDGRRLVLLVRETAPLGTSYFVNSLLVSFPRLFVERSLGLSAVGLLTVASYFQQAGTMLVTSISQALVNRFARLRRGSAAKAVRKIIWALLGFATVFSVAGVLLAYSAGEWVLREIFGEEFASAHGLLLLMALAVATKLYAMIPQTILHADRRFNTFLLREVASVLLCVVLLVLLVPAWGLIGAGYAILATQVFRLLVMTVATAFAGGKRSLHQQPSPASGGMAA